MREAKTKKTLTAVTCLGVWMGLSSTVAAATVVADFSEVVLPASNYVNGSEDEGGYASGGIWFANSFTDFGGGFTSWAGWAVSAVNNPDEPGYGNQYAAITGGGVTEGGAVETGNAYGVGYIGGGAGTILMPAQITAAPQSVWVTNNAYAYHSMVDGDDFSKKFGGPDGTAPDFFRVHISGRDAHGAVTGTATVYLADYRFDNSEEDYVLGEWTQVDLTPLGEGVVSLQFEAESSDEGVFGINTPTYLVLDRLALALSPQIIDAAVDNGNGWKYVSWLGHYNDALAPWVYHYPLGWIGWRAEDTSDIWFYSAEAEAWFWTREGYYPFIYRATQDDWVYFFHLSQPGALHYYEVDTGRWINDASHL